MKGKIICINASIHKVLLENNTIIDTRTRGKLRNDKVHPVVGDNVIVDVKTNKDINYCIIDGGINHVNYYGQTLAMKLPVISHYPEKSGEMKEWAICGSLCTAADLLVRKYPFTDLAIGDLLVFENIGAYSITEGIYLFLSRQMPRVILYSKDTGAVMVRDFYNSDILNTIRE